MVPGDLPDRDPPRVWACAAQSHRLVPSASCPGPDGDPPAHPRAGARPAAVRLFADLGPVTAGGLAGESETGAPVVPPRVQLRMRVRRRKHIALHRGTRSGMKRSKFSEEQVAYALRQAEAGTAVGDVCRQLGISEATFRCRCTSCSRVDLAALRWRDRHLPKTDVRSGSAMVASYDSPLGVRDHLKRCGSRNPASGCGSSFAGRGRLGRHLRPVVADTLGASVSRISIARSRSTCARCSSRRRRPSRT